MSGFPAPALSTIPLTFAHVSDLHLPHEPELTWAQRFSKRQLSAWSWRKRRAVQRPEILDALRADIRARAPDHVVVTGDITNFGLPEEFAKAELWLAGLTEPGGLSIVPGNHDALMPLDAAAGIGRWQAFTAGGEWPYVVRRRGVSFIGVSSALPTAPLLAAGNIGAAQLQKLDSLLRVEGGQGQARVVLLHHPLVDGAVSARKALRDRAALRGVLATAGAELVLHGHARAARLETVPGPQQPIPVLCVPSSSALPNPHDEAARWHLVSMPGEGVRERWARVQVRQWSLASAGFEDAADYQLRLPDRSDSRP
jgi:3',5'-cyclic AMP phosphodiesterase CpdA